MAAHQVNITDRAKRYRAQNNVQGPRKCVLCGSRSDLGVMHLSGNEAHGETANLAYGCRSCNGKLSAAFKTLNLGKPTNQYNPAKAAVPTFEQYMWAVANHDKKTHAHDAGGAVIHATPKHKRIEYARRIVSKAQQTKRDRLDDRWNPATRQNLFGFGKGKDARRTTPAHGGIAYHQGKMKARKTADDRNAEFLKTVKSKGKKSAGASATPDEAALQAGFKRGLTLREMLAANPALRKSQKANPGAFAKLLKRVKVNPAAASADVFEEFHGYAPKEVIKVVRERHHHNWLASAGDLVGLQVRPISGGEKRKIEGLGECFFAFNEAKNQLFIEGGDQRMSPAELKKFGIRDEHEIQTLGKLIAVGYFTNKKHLGSEGGEAVYSHTFRSTNENGKHVIVKIARYPDLIYRVMDEQFEVSGGSYEILREGINK